MAAPTVTIVDSVEPANNRIVKMTRRNCCLCIPEDVGVFAILSMDFFLGIFYAAASFGALGQDDDAATKALFAISGCLHTFLAIISALGISAIRKKKVVMMRRLSIAFWIITVLMLIFSTIIYILAVVFKSSYLEECETSVLENYGEDGQKLVDCERIVNETLTGEAIKQFITGLISLYFAYVIYKYAKQMNKEELPFIAPIDGQRSPVYIVSAQPPTSNNWQVPPPVYTVRPANPLPDDFNPDEKRRSN